MSTMSTDCWSLHDTLNQIVGDLQRCLTRVYVTLPERSDGATLVSMDLLYEEVNAMAKDISSVVHNIAKHVGYRRNALTTINSLPDEMLSRIFMETSSGNAIKSMPLSQTCSRWRDVSINCASLWSQIGPANTVSRRPRGHQRQVDLAALFFERTQEYPVSVNLAYRKIPKDILARVGHHISHIRSLEITSRMTNNHSLNSARLQFEQHQWLFHDAAPMLRNLVFCTDYNAVLPGGFFEGGTPTLTHLTMKSCEITSWANACYKGLTHLDIENIILKFNEQDRGDNGDFLQVLRACPQLESLKVSSKYHLLSTMSSTSTDVISLPQLRELGLKTEPLLGDYILSHIATPNMSLRLSCRFIRMLDGTVLDMPFRHQEHFTVLTSGFTELRIHLGKDLKICSSLAVEELVSPQSLAGAFVEIIFEDWALQERGNLVFPNMMSWMASSESMMSLLHLEIQGINNSINENPVADTLLALLRHTPNITTLTDGRGFPGFWNSLMTEHRNPHFLPALTTIEFYGNVRDIKGFITTWQSEQRAGPHLQEVRVRKYVDEEWLRDIVDKVVEC